MARTKQLSKKGGKPKNEKTPRKKTQILKTPKSPKSSKKPEEKKRRSTVDAEKKERKPRRFKASTIAAREHKRYSTGRDATKLLLQKKPFANLVRERLQDYTTEFRISKNAFRVIQEGMEAWLERMMEKTIPLCRLGKRMSPTAEIVRIAAESLPDRERF